MHPAPDYRQLRALQSSLRPSKVEVGKFAFAGMVAIASNALKSVRRRVGHASHLVRKMPDGLGSPSSLTDNFLERHSV